MCGRFALYASAEELEDTFDLVLTGPVAPRYNIAPGQKVLGVRAEEQGHQGVMLSWGLVPSWAKAPNIGARLINARSETVGEKPAFRDAFRQRRCLVPASGFYEWSRDRTRQPYFFSPSDGGLCAFAGLWEVWTSSVGERLESCTILTTESRDPVSRIHARMPVMIPRQAFGLWLGRDARAARALLEREPIVSLGHHAVGKDVGNVALDSPACIAPAARSHLSLPLPGF
jgi:putative SOS response-associated peptidase YedK